MLEPPAVTAWSPWSPSKVAEVLSNIQVDWFVAGGWAIDLWLSRETRVHEDIEIVVLRSDFEMFRTALSHFHFFAAVDGSVLEVGSGPLETAVNQIWILDDCERRWKLDVMLDAGDEDTWVFRRDHCIRRKRNDAVGRSFAGIPHLNPEIVLLYKASRMSLKDISDFENCLPRMNVQAKDWLRETLVIIHSDHAWIDQLT